MLMSQSNREAKLRYLANSFRVLVPGDHVTCAISGEKIPLERLKYWSVARQEPYATPEASVKAELGR